MGLSKIGNNCLDTASVAGRSRVPEPPARMMPFRPFFCIANCDLYQVAADNAASLSELTFLPRGRNKKCITKDTLIDWNNSFAPSHDRSRSQRAQPIWHCRDTSALSCVFLSRTSRMVSILARLRSSPRRSHIDDHGRDDRQ